MSVNRMVGVQAGVTVGVRVTVGVLVGMAVEIGVFVGVPHAGWVKVSSRPGCRLPAVLHSY